MLALHVDNVEGVVVGQNLGTRRRCRVQQTIVAIRKEDHRLTRNILNSASLDGRRYTCLGVFCWTHLLCEANAEAVELTARLYYLLRAAVKETLLIHPHH